MEALGLVGTKPEGSFYMAINAANSALCDSRTLSSSLVVLVMLTGMVKLRAAVIFNYAVVFFSY